MTESEAIERLKCLRLFMKIEDKKSESKFLEDDYTANDMAIKALKKQIPKKWGSDDLGDGEYVYKCPCCNEYWALMEGTPKDNEYNYCPKCGQKLEWSDTGAESI